MEGREPPDNGQWSFLLRPLRLPNQEMASKPKRTKPKNGTTGLLLPKQNKARRHGTNGETSYSAWMHPITLSKRRTKWLGVSVCTGERAVHLPAPPPLNTAPPTGVHSHSGRREPRNGDVHNGGH